MTKETTRAAALSICCRPLVDAFRREPDAGSEAAIVVGFDETGAPFYRFARMHGGQLMSAPAEPLVFCPFCGHRVVGGDEEHGANVAASEPDGWRTSLRMLEETLELEIETLIASRIRTQSGEHAAQL